MRVLTPTLQEIAKIRKFDVSHWRDRGLLVSDSPRWSALEWEPAEILIAAALREFQRGTGNLPDAPWMEKIPPLIRGQWPNYANHWLMVDRTVVRLVSTETLERRLRRDLKRAVVVLDILPLFAEITWALRVELRQGNGCFDALRRPETRRSSSGQSVDHTSDNGRSTQPAGRH